MIQPMQNCFGKFERLVWKGLHRWGEHVRVALSGTSSRRFTVSPAWSQFFGDGLAGCVVCGFLFGLGVVFVVWLLVWFASPTDEILYSFELCANSMQSWTTVRAVMARTAWEKKKPSNCTITRGEQELAGTNVSPQQRSVMEVRETW